MPESADEILIARAKRGDADAITQLYRRNVQRIARYIGYRVPDTHAVEDLTADVFLRMIESLPTYRITGAPFEAWLYRIAAARIADYYRRSQREARETLAQQPLDANDEPSPEQALQHDESIAELRAALQQLTAEQQTILLLRFVERKSHEEVAQIVGKSTEATATAQHRALKRLAELLGIEKLGRHYLRGKTE